MSGAGWITFLGQGRGTVSGLNCSVPLFVFQRAKSEVESIRNVFVDTF